MHNILKYNNTAILFLEVLSQLGQRTQASKKRFPKDVMHYLPKCRLTQDLPKNPQRKLKIVGFHRSASKILKVLKVGGWVGGPVFKETQIEAAFLFGVAP